MSEIHIFLAIHYWMKALWFLKKHFSFVHMIFVSVINSDGASKYAADDWTMYCAPRFTYSAAPANIITLQSVNRKNNQSI